MPPAWSLLSSHNPAPEWYTEWILSPLPLLWPLKPRPYQPLSGEGFPVQQNARERNLGSSGKRQVSGTRARSATCFHIPVSEFFFLPHIFQSYSPPPRINSMTMTAPRMPHGGAALVSWCKPVSLTERMKNDKTRENLRYSLLRGDREQVERSKVLVQKLNGRTWHSLKQVLSCCLMPETLRWTRCAHPWGRLRRCQSLPARETAVQQSFILCTQDFLEIFSDKVMCHKGLEGGVGVYHPGRPWHSR